MKRLHSINPAVNALFVAYLTSMNIEMHCTIAFERYLFDAHKAGVTPKMIRDVVIARRKRILQGARQPESLKLRNLVGDDEAIADLQNEAAIIVSLTRVKIVPVCKAAVLAASGRPAYYKDRTTMDPGTENTAKSVAHYIAAMREAVDRKGSAA